MRKMKQVPSKEIEIRHSEFETPPQVSGGGVAGMLIVLAALFTTFGYATYLVTEYIWNMVFG